MLGISGIGYYSPLDRVTLSDLVSGVVPGLCSLGYAIDLVHLDSQTVQHTDPTLNVYTSELLLKFLRLDGAVNSTFPEAALMEVSEFIAEAKSSTVFLDDESECYYLLKYGQGKKTKSNRTILEEAVIRNAVFTITHSELVQSMDELHKERREIVSQFFLTAAGKRRDRISNRLRSAAHFLMTDPLVATDILLEAAVIAYRLPEVAENALLLPSNSELNRREIRELCYFARAGKSGLRAICAHKLSGLQVDDAETSLLNELSYDPDPWVRTAAGAPRLQ